MGRSVCFIGALLLALAGCGAQEGEKAADEALAQPAALADIEIEGRYQVTGVTVDRESGAQRPIFGQVNLLVEGDRYTGHFELSTRFPGSEATAASVVGTGEGTVKGAVLEGPASTQLVAASVPGVDVDFAFIPREVSLPLLSRSKAEFFPDGSVRIEIENEPAEGVDYSPTVTHLVGYREEG